jgi:hypothetical protein
MRSGTGAERHVDVTFRQAGVHIWGYRTALRPSSPGC